MLIILQLGADYKCFHHLPHPHHIKSSYVIKCLAPKIGLPKFTNKNLRHPFKSEFQINNE